MEAASREALICCRGMMDDAQLARFPVTAPNGDTAYLTFHVGVGAGPLTMLIMGSGRTWKYCLVGPGVAQCTDMCAFGRNGEFVLSHEMYAMVKDVCEVVPAGACRGYVLKNVNLSTAEEKVRGCLLTQGRALSALFQVEVTLRQLKDRAHLPQQSLCKPSPSERKATVQENYTTCPLARAVSTLPPLYKLRQCTELLRSLRLL